MLGAARLTKCVPVSFCRDPCWPLASLRRLSYRSAFVGGGEVTYTAVCRSPRIEAGGINWCTFVPPSSGRETLVVELWCPENRRNRGKVNLTLSSPSNVVDPG